MHKVFFFVKKGFRETGALKSIFILSIKNVGWTLVPYPKLELSFDKAVR